MGPKKRQNNNNGLNKRSVNCPSGELAFLFLSVTRMLVLCCKNTSVD